jgi:calcium binding protein 39
MMNLLRDEARSIQFEAFHVFKVFVVGAGSGPDARMRVTVFTVLP